MMFTKRLREPIMRGEITCTVRIWRSLRVKVGGRYPLGGGFVEVTRVQQVDLSDITEEIARASGFADPFAHADLIAAAGDDARLVMARDPELKSARGRALQVLSELFDWKAGMALRDAG